MWFIATVHPQPNFCAIDGSIIEHDDVKINWVTEATWEEDGHIFKVGPSSPFINDAQQAISALYDAGVKGYPNKIVAKNSLKPYLTEALNI
jgi:hypothetical protein